MARYTMIPGRRDSCVRLNNRRTSSASQVGGVPVSLERLGPWPAQENHRNQLGYNPLLGRKFQRLYRQRYDIHV